VYRLLQVIQRALGLLLLALDLQLRVQVVEYFYRLDQQFKRQEKLVYLVAQVAETSAVTCESQQEFQPVMQAVVSL
jgi:hypothetical protein